MKSWFGNVAKSLWSVKGKAARLPGAYWAYQQVTKRMGEGRVYSLHFGAMKGFRWQRDNRLPYWYHLGLWEPEVSGLLEQHLRPGDVFWDVGANAGYHTLLARRIVGERGAVVAFEPDPAMFTVLRTQLELNGYGDVRCDPHAISASIGTVSFSRHANPLMGGIAAYVDGAHVEVPTLTLDAALERYPRPDVIKIDVEGAEVEVLQGATQLLAMTPRPRWFVSTHGERPRAGCEAILRQKGYDLSSSASFDQMIVAEQFGATV